MTDSALTHGWSFPEADFLGCRLSPIGAPDVLAAVDQAIRERRPLLHAVLNAAKVVRAARDDRFRSLLNSFDLIQADGMSIVWAARLIQGRHVPRLAGADLMPLLLEHAERRGYRVYFLGATDDVLNLMRERLARRFPTLRVAGARNGYFPPDAEADVARQIAAAEADLLFVGMPTPRKESFLATHGRRLGIGFGMGVGGTFDVLAGRVRRAPVMIQKAGLEWAWRLAQEPGRLGRRYLASHGRFALLVLRARLTSSAPRALPASRRRRRMRLLVLGAAIGLALAVAEGALRLKGDVPRFPRFLSARRLQDGTMIRQNQPGAVYWHSSPEGAWEFRINSSGFRDDEEVEPIARGDRFRILTLGDSFTVGYEVAAEHTWPQQLENELLRFSRQPVEVINTGVSGFGTAEEYAFLRDEGFRHEPDLVVVGVYANDFQDSVRADLFRLRGGDLVATGKSYTPGICVAGMLQALPGFSSLAQSSHLYALFNERAAMFVKQHVLGRGAPRAAHESLDESALDLVAALLERIIDDAGDRGVPVILLDIASREGVDALPDGRLDPRHRLQVVRTAGLYDDCCAPDGAFRKRGHGHWTPLGHAAAGRAVADRIRTQDGLRPAGF